MQETNLRLYTVIIPLNVKFRKNQNFGDREQASDCQVLKVEEGLIGAA